MILISCILILITINFIAANGERNFSQECLSCNSGLEPGIWCFNESTCCSNPAFLASPQKDNQNSVGNANGSGTSGSGSGPIIPQTCTYSGGNNIRQPWFNSANCYAGSHSCEWIYQAGYLPLTCQQCVSTSAFGYQQTIGSGDESNCFFCKSLGTCMTSYRSCTGNMCPDVPSEESNMPIGVSYCQNHAPCVWYGGSCSRCMTDSCSYCRGQCAPYGTCDLSSDPSQIRNTNFCASAVNPTSFLLEIFILAGFVGFCVSILAVSRVLCSDVFAFVNEFIGPVIDQITGCEKIVQRVPRITIAYSVYSAIVTVFTIVTLMNIAFVATGKDGHPTPVKPGEMCVPIFEKVSQLVTYESLFGSKNGYNNAYYDTNALVFFEDIYIGPIFAWDGDHVSVTLYASPNKTGNCSIIKDWLESGDMSSDNIRVAEGTPNFTLSDGKAAPACHPGTCCATFTTIFRGHLLFVVLVAVYWTRAFGDVILMIYYFRNPQQRAGALAFAKEGLGAVPFCLYVLKHVIQTRLIKKDNENALTGIHIPRATLMNPVLATLSAIQLVLEGIGAPVYLFRSCSTNSPHSMKFAILLLLKIIPMAVALWAVWETVGRLLGLCGKIEEKVEEVEIEKEKCILQQGGEYREVE